MRLFLYEYLCGSGVFSSMRSEGWGMLSALVDDFRRLPGCEVWTLLDQHCPAELGDRCFHTPADDFKSLAAAADAVMGIAPETDGILANLGGIVLEAKRRWLGCTPTAIDLCADKLALAEFWQRQGVPTPRTVAVSTAAPAEVVGLPAVLKPRFGAGSQATFLIHDRRGLDECWQQARAEMPLEDFIMQPLADGQPASIAFLVGPATMVPLMPATQRISTDGRFHYLGGEVPLAPALARRAVDLGRRALDCVNGLLGYVGVDLILAEEGHDQAIEINPRLTTSYLGLRRLCRQNLAAAMWDVCLEKAPPALTWREGAIRF